MVAEPEQQVIKILVKNGSKSIKCQATPQSDYQQIHQLVLESDEFDYLTCFSLELNNGKVSGLIGDAQEEIELHVVPEDYNLSRLKIHLSRVIGLLGQQFDEFGIEASSSLGRILEKPCEFSFSTFDANEQYGISKPICLKGIFTTLPTLHEKSKGHLLNLIIETLEGESWNCICSTSGFQVKEATFPSLITLLKDISPLFNSRFEELQEMKRDSYFDFVGNSHHFYPWLVMPQEKDIGHSLDLFLKQEQAVDWNEEIQMAKEAPKSTGQECVYRDQIMYKSQKNFLDNAIKGAISVINGDVPPLNPLEEEFSHMYLHNNIFYSRGYDNKEHFDKYGGEAAAHVSVSKDLDGIRALNRLDIDGVYTLGTVVVDYKGHRIVAQSVVPGIFGKIEEDEGSSVKYGSIDNGDTIIIDEAFKPVIEKVAKAFSFKSHQVQDKQGKNFALQTSVETKGVLGTDGRHYLLDLYRFYPVDCEFLKSAPDYPHKMAFLRPELMEIFYQTHVRELVDEYQKQKKAWDANEASKPQKKRLPEPKEPDLNDIKIQFNPDAYTLARMKETEDPQVVEFSQFVKRLISQLVIDIVRVGISIPVDSRSLTVLFHSRGINMRYLGQVAELFEKITDFPVTLFGSLLKREMVARACKSILRSLLKNTPIHKVSEIVADFFNCLLGDGKVDKHDSRSLQDLVRKQIRIRFRYHMKEDLKVEKLLLVKTICLMVGIQLKARNYNFDSPRPFSAVDIYAIVPVIKHTLPRASFAEEAMEQGNIHIAQNKKDIGQALIREATNQYELTYGPIHPETARGYAIIAMNYFEQKDYESAIFMQKRCVNATERTSGMDDIETIQQLNNLAYYYHCAGNSEKGLKIMNHSLAQMQLIYGDNVHPDMPTALSNTAAMLQSLGKSGIDLFIKSAEQNEQLFGTNHAFSIASREALAEAYYQQKEYKNALIEQKKVYAYFKSVHGIKDERTLKQAKSLELLTKLAVEAAKKLK